MKLPTKELIVTPNISVLRPSPSGKKRGAFSTALWTAFRRQNHLIVANLGQIWFTYGRKKAFKDFSNRLRLLKNQVHFTTAGLSGAL